MRNTLLPLELKAKCIDCFCYTDIVFAWNDIPQSKRKQASITKGTAHFSLWLKEGSY